MTKQRLYHVEIVSLELPQDFSEVKADYVESTSLFVNVTPQQLTELLTPLVDGGSTFVDVYRQTPKTHRKGQRLFSGVPSQVPHEMCMA